MPAADESERGTLARVERLERRIGVAGDAAPAAPPAPGSAKPIVSTPAPTEESAKPIVSTPAPAEPAAPAEAPAPTKAPAPAASPTDVTFDQLKDAWSQIVEAVGERKRTAWAVVFTAKPMGLKDDVLALAFPSENDVAGFRQPQAAGESVSEILRQAIVDVLGIRVKFIARVDASAKPQRTEPPHDDVPPPDEEPEPAPEEPGGWAVAQIPNSEPPAERQAPGPAAAPTVAAPPKAEAAPLKAAATPAPTKPSRPAAPPSASGARPSNVPPPRQRYGESVVRELLNASFIEEQPIEQRVTPMEG